MLKKQNIKVCKNVHKGRGGVGAMRKDGYIKIKNQDGKTWILPKKNLVIALNLYQPTSVRGILLKKYFPVCMKVQLFGWLIKKILHIQDCDLEVPEEVIDMLKEVFDDEEIEFAYFAGTPSAHQKGTIQIATKDKILGYAKFSNVNMIQSLFYEEKEFLDWLSKCQVKNIPKCLLCEEIENGTTIFIQDTEKTTKSRIVHKSSDLHIAFVRELCEKTKVECDYENTDYCKMIQVLKENLAVLDNLDIEAKVMLESISLIEESLKNEKVFSAFHGDFTPWNTFIENNNLYVFDYEYARRTYPKYLDVFHFFTQTMLFEKNGDAHQIMKLFQKEFGLERYRGLFENPYVSYLQYLVSIIAFYVERDKGMFQQEVINNLKIRYELVRKLLSYLEVIGDSTDKI